MEIPTRDRADLKSYFVKNAIPTEGNFAELIDGMLNQADDGLVKLSGDPLSIEAAGDDSSEKKAIHFYQDFDDDHPAWVLSLSPNRNLAQSGLNIGDGEGHSRLCIDRNTGSIGIGTTEPGAKLQIVGGQDRVSLRVGQGGGGADFTMDVASGQGLVSLVAGAKIKPDGSGYTFLGARGASRVTLHDGSIRFYTSDETKGTPDGDAIGLSYPEAKMILDSQGNVGIGTTDPQQRLVLVGTHGAGKDPDSGMQYGGSLAIKSNAPQIDFIDTDHNDWSIHVNANKMYFIRQPWNYLDLVLDGAGNVGIGTDAPTAKLDVVDGWAHFWGRRGSYKVGEVPGNGGWHSILTKLNGHQAYEVIADISQAGLHGLTHAIVTCTYGPPQGHPGISITQADYAGGKIELRWTGSTYDFNLQIRTVVAYNSGVNITYRLLKLW